MGKINVLPPQLISKIAAGEVIQRPASVLKELIENSIDAKASKIDISLEKAGKILISLKDNGTGIEKEDLQKIFLRHSTSKISSAEDLFNINSLGFRGEALYSVHAIADIIIQSKIPSEDCGWLTHARGTEIKSLEPCTMNNGTTIEVRELFFNTPARRKFLKTDQTELNQIFNVLNPYVLFHKDISFSLTNNNRSLLDIPVSDTKKQRMAKALNVDEKNLIKAKISSKDKTINITLILGNINIQRVKRDMQYIFINSRPVQNKTVSFHLNQMFKLIFPSNVFGAFACFVDMPRADIDVNIHPTKSEVKLKNERDIIPMLRRAAENALMQQGDAKQITDDIKDIDFSIEDKHQTQVQMPKDKSYEKLEKALADSSSPSLDQDNSEVLKNDDLAASKQYVLFKDSLKKDDSPFATEKKASDSSLADKLKNASYIGIFMRKYLLFELVESMLIIDQHAAQERISYEELINQINSKNLEVQRLLSPITVNLTAGEKLSWENSSEILENLGFDTNEWKDNSIAIHAHPVLIKKPEQAIMNILSDGQTQTFDLDDVARRACRSSVKAGDRLDKTEALAIKENLLLCNDPFTCPHGRPTVLEITDKFLNRQFLRG